VSPAPVGTPARDELPISGHLGYASPVWETTHRRTAQGGRDMSDERTPQEQIKEGIWRISLQVVVILVAMAFGVFVGHLMWGDAPALKEQVGTLTQNIQELKNDREAQAGRQALCERDKKDFKKRLDKLFDQNNELKKELTDLKAQAGTS
jgi:hypothetical protein